MNVIDTHCHLDLVEEKGQKIEVSIKRAKELNIKKILQIATNFQNSLKCKAIAYNFSSEDLEICYTVGEHPTDVTRDSSIEPYLDLVDLDDKKLVALGEIGLDYYHSKDTKKYQESLFHRFIEKSIEYKLPIVIHSRDSFLDTKAILKQYRGKVFGVMHCFSYDYKAAKDFIDLGFYISLSGVLTFKNAKDLHETGVKIPLDVILVETDAPFLAPMPYRGKMNEPAYVSHTLDYLIGLRKEKDKEVIDTIYNNSLKFFDRKAYFHV